MDNYDIEIVNILKNAEKERYNLRHPYVGTEHLLLSILNNNKEIISFLNNYNLTYNNFKCELIKIVGMASKTSDINLYTPLLKRVINNAINNSKESGNPLSVKELVLSLLEEGEGIAIRVLIGMHIDIDKIYDDLKSNIKKNSNLELFYSGIIMNDNINIDEKVIGREKEIDMIIETLLRKKKNNPLLIGDAGVGKSAIVEELVRRIELKDVPDLLLNKKVVSVSMGNLVSGTKYRGEFEEKVTKIIKELENNQDIILFIDEVHTMVNAGGAEGAITAGDIFKPALARGNIHLIGATTTDEYLKYFSKDKALMRRFEVINICEPDLDKTKEILLKIKNEYENHHKVKISNKNINDIVLLTDKYIPNKKNPDKSIDFLDSVCSKCKTNNEYELLKRNIYKKIGILNNKKNKLIKEKDFDNAINIYSEELELKNKIELINKHKAINIKTKDILDVLENKTNMIFNIDKLDFLNKFKYDAIKELNIDNYYIDLLISLIKDNIKNKNGNLKVLLEGNYTYKTSLIKLLSNIWPKCNYIYIDLKEYNNIYDMLNKGIFNILKNNMFNIILFDNYDDCSKEVKNIIINILKDNYILDNNDKISFNNSYIFINKNINNTVGFTNKNSKDDVIYELLNNKIVFNEKRNKLYS